MLRQATQSCATSASRILSGQPGVPLGAPIQEAVALVEYTNDDGCLRSLGYCREPSLQIQLSYNPHNMCILPISQKYRFLLPKSHIFGLFSLFFIRLRATESTWKALNSSPFSTETATNNRLGAGTWGALYWRGIRAPQQHAGFPRARNTDQLVKKSFIDAAVCVYHREPLTQDSIFNLHPSRVFYCERCRFSTRQIAPRDLHR
jgi:hypothetical protein